MTPPPLRLGFFAPHNSVSVDHMQAAVAQLDLLGALERKDNQLTLTPIGRKMAAFPLEPKFAKVSHPSPWCPLCPCMAHCP